MFLRLPVDRLSTTVTCAPISSRASVSQLPRKPAPPKINTFFSSSSSSVTSSFSSSDMVLRARGARA